MSTSSRNDERVANELRRMVGMDNSPCRICAFRRTLRGERLVALGKGGRPLREVCQGGRLLLRQYSGSAHGGEHSEPPRPRRRSGRSAADAALGVRALRGNRRADAGQHHSPSTRTRVSVGAHVRRRRGRASRGCGGGCLRRGAQRGRALPRGPGRRRCPRGSRNLGALGHRPHRCRTGTFGNAARVRRAERWVRAAARGRSARSKLGYGQRETAVRTPHPARKGESQAGVARPLAPGEIRAVSSVGAVRQAPCTSSPVRAAPKFGWSPVVLPRRRSSRSPVARRSSFWSLGRAKGSPFAAACGSTPPSLHRSPRRTRSPGTSARSEEASAVLPRHRRHHPCTSKTKRS